MQTLVDYKKNFHPQLDYRINVVRKSINEFNKSQTFDLDEKYFMDDIVHRSIPDDKKKFYKPLLSIKNPDFKILRQNLKIKTAIFKHYNLCLTFNEEIADLIFVINEDWSDVIDYFEDNRLYETIGVDYFITNSDKIKNFVKLYHTAVLGLYFIKILYNNYLHALIDKKHLLYAILANRKTKTFPKDIINLILKMRVDFDLHEVRNKTLLQTIKNYVSVKFLKNASDEEILKKYENTKYWWFKDTITDELKYFNGEYELRYDEWDGIIVKI